MEYREKININQGWESVLSGDGGQDLGTPEAGWDWQKVTVPHNWEDYQGYHRVSHGNLHGTAWYRRSLAFREEWKGKRVFLFFEGVGSYGDVWVNRQYVGGHAGGRTCFGLDITRSLVQDRENIILVRARHPEKIADLPWICGGCYGTPNSEGSQPLGIFRPVHIVVTGDVRVKPFGVGITTAGLTGGCPDVHIECELQNHGKESMAGRLRQELLDPAGYVIRTEESGFQVEGGGECCMVQEIRRVEDARLWYPDAPVLYRIRTTVLVQGEILDQVENSFGFREIVWENFDTGSLERIDQGKLAEEPCEGNQYFVTYTRGSSSSPVAIVPGGVKVTLPEFTGDRAVISIETTLVNQDVCGHKVQLESFVQTYNRTKSIANLVEKVALQPGEVRTVTQVCDPVQFPDLWSREDPYLHNVMSTVRGIDEAVKEYCQTSTSFAIHGKKGIVNKGNAWVVDEQAQSMTKRRFLVNGKHYFLNGTCEYEHELGHDHAFSEEMIRTRIHMLQAAGFNALREAHCPHNLRYLELCEQQGILYWAQMGAHIYFDTEAFQENFLRLTGEWVKERRNSPAVILWSIQNESMLPVEFTRRVTALIRGLDATSPGQRKVVTCNGGAGSDWNVPQNWSGTYGGSVEEYAREAVKMRLIGEYGQYRVQGKHEEGHMEQRQNAGGDVSEELFAYCLETKVREAEKVREHMYGHFQWLLVSHANPGRERFYCLDGMGSNQVGVVNSKGLFTSWGEPTDAYYMYRASYTSPEEAPVLYLVSHTWPDRFTRPCRADIVAYSNCDEVLLYCGYGEETAEVVLGAKKGAVGEHFTFRDVDIRYGILTAKGYCQGRWVVTDRLRFPALPMPDVPEGMDIPGKEWVASHEKDVYRVNCGGEAYEDSQGRIWLADQPLAGGTWGWTSWGSGYEDVEDEIGSVAECWDEVENCADQGLLQTFRYGRDLLSYTFPVEDGAYEVHLYFVEPWYGRAGENAAGWRLFDVAINDVVCLKGLDIWQEASGAGKLLQKHLTVAASQGYIRISFPEAASNQALVHAIRITRVS